jgi:hypothetical protein
VKPLVTEGYVICSEAPGRPVFLSGDARTVTTEIAHACRFADPGDAYRAMRAFVDRHQHAHHGVTTWEVLRATTRTTFKPT